MDREMMLALARAAGLDRALELFPDDVAAAAAQADGNAAGFKAPQSPSAEPWPPMRPGSGAGTAL
jgi:hypothetical protein